MHCWTERQHEDIKEARNTWQEWQQQLLPEDLKCLIFIDETSVNNCSFSRCYGRALEGWCATGKFPKAK